MSFISSFFALAHRQPVFVFCLRGHNPLRGHSPLPFWFSLLVLMIPFFSLFLTLPLLLRRECGVERGECALTPLGATCVTRLTFFHPPLCPRCSNAPLVPQRAPRASGRLGGWPPMKRLTRLTSVIHADVPLPSLSPLPPHPPTAVLYMNPYCRLGASPGPPTSILRGK